VIDTKSSDWAHIQQYALRRIGEINKELAKHRLDMADTEFSRGRLEEMEALLRLPQKMQEQPVAPQDPYDEDTDE